MTTPIRALIDAIEAGEIKSVPQFVDLANACDFLPGDALLAFNGSTDGAYRFLEDSLPRAWSRLSGPWPDDNGQFEWSAKVYPPGVPSHGYTGRHHLFPSRALLIATLKAMEAVQ
jgi:hypothetical protein